MDRRNHRTTWRTLTLAVALTATTAVTTARIVSGQTSADETVFVPVTPCRLIDTRNVGDLNTGPRSTPVGADEAALFNAHDGSDANSPCTIPASATAVATNTVAVNPTARGFLTLYPGDVANPGTANLNFVAGQAPTPKAANIPLAPDGSFNVYNAFGTVNVVIDVNGYYQPSTAIGQPGPTGPPGAPGPVGGTESGHSISAVDSSGGIYSSIAIGTNGNPVISYLGSNPRDLKVAACNNPTCTTATVSQVDTEANAETSIAIGTNGNPVISYGLGGLKVAACSDPICASATIRSLDASGASFQNTSIAIGADNNPVIAYRDREAGGLKVAACNNPTCSTATMTHVDPIDGSGEDAEIAIGTNGNPVISYFQNGLKVAVCNNPVCSSAAITAIDSDGGHDGSITIGANGNPIISYIGSFSGNLRVAACNNPTCGTATITEFDTIYFDGLDTSITIGADGHPVISHHHADRTSLLVTACDNPTCSAATTTTLDNDGETGELTSIVIGLDNRPVISYWERGNGLKVAACGNTTCTDYSPRNR